MHEPVPKPTLQRLPLYLGYLHSLPKEAGFYVSASSIAHALRLHDVLVRKDLALISECGKPKVGYNIEQLTVDIERILGYDKDTHAVMIGTDKMAEALLSHDSLSFTSLIVDSIFDPTGDMCGNTMCGREILPMSKLPSAYYTGARVGILCVPAEDAQLIDSKIVSSGIRAIWNFSPAHLQVPKDVFVLNDSIAPSFSSISRFVRFGSDS